MRKTMSGGLMAIGLAIAVFLAPSTAWAEPGTDESKDKHDDTVAEQAAEEPEEELEYQPPASEEEQAVPEEEYVPPPVEEYTEPVPEQEEWVPEYAPPQEEYTEPEYTEPEYVEPEYTEPSADDPGSDEVLTGDEPAAAPDAVTTEEQTDAVECESTQGRGHGNDADGTLVGPVAPVGPLSTEACEVPGADSTKDEPVTEDNEKVAIAALPEPGEAESTIDINPGNVPTTAVGFTTISCDHVGDGPLEGQDGWVFVYPGGKKEHPQFVAIEADFGVHGIVPGTVLVGPGTSKAVVLTPLGWTLDSASAVVQNGGGEFFNLTHACPGTGGPRNPPPPPPPPPPGGCENPPCEPPPPPPEECDNPPCEEPPGEEPPVDEPPVVMPPVAEQPPCESETVVPPVIAEPPAQPPVALTPEFAGPVLVPADDSGLALTGRAIDVLVAVGLILLTAGGLALFVGADRPFARRFHI